MRRGVGWGAARAAGGTAAALIAYVGLHVAARDAYLGSPEVERLVASRVGAVAVVADPETGRLVLDARPTPRAGLMPWRRAGDASGRVLIEARRELARSDEALEHWVRARLAPFRRVAGQPGRVEAPLSSFGVAGAEPGQVVRLRTGDVRPFADWPAGARGARRLIDALAGAEVLDLRVSAPESRPRADAEIREPLDGWLPGVRTSLAEVDREVEERRVRLRGKPLASPTPAELVTAACAEIDRLREPTVAYFGSAIVGGLGCGGGDATRAAPDGVLRDRLRLAVGIDLGFFWTVGRWRWLELAAIAAVVWIAVLLVRRAVRARDAAGSACDAREEAEPGAEAGAGSSQEPAVRPIATGGRHAVAPDFAALRAGIVREATAPLRGAPS